MESLAQTESYRDTSTTDTTTMGYYVIKFLSNTLKLKDDSITDEQIFKYFELEAKYAYKRGMEYKDNFSLDPEKNQHIIIVSP